MRIRPNNPTPSQIRFYKFLLQVRPAQLAALIKSVIGIRRMLIRTGNGLIYWADPVSIFGIHLLTDGLHEPILTHVFELTLHPNDIFIDIGGNEGYFSILAASLVRHGTVFCLEPQTRLQPILRENIRLNSASHIDLHQVAISDGPGEVALFLRPTTNTGASSFYRHWRLGGQKEIVPATSLDKFCTEHNIKHARLLKVDCEGAEPLVIKGGSTILQQRGFDFLALEYHPAICGIQNCLAIHQQLKSYGYVLTKVGPHLIYHRPGLEQELVPLGEIQIDTEWQGSWAESSRG